MTSKVRHPSHAGAFYAGTKNVLRRQIEECFKHRYGPGEIPVINENGSRRIVGLICPHAGYMYSGPVAANSYYQLALDGKIEVFVIMGPNHYGVGSGLATVIRGVWRTPLGDVEVDSELAERIVAESGIIDVDEYAHLYEHSIEVQLPFLQYIYGTFRFVPICFLMQDLQSSREIGEAIARAIKGRNAVIIASTDLTHYEPQYIAEKKDKMVIDAVLKLDENLLYSVLESQRISACGYGPVAALLVASKKLGAKNVELLCYRTSGDVTGDRSSVVGYASIMLRK